MHDDDKGLQTYIPLQGVAAFLPHRERPLSMEDAALKWVKTKTGRSGSEKTKRAYWDTYAQFKTHLEHEGVPLDGDPRTVARIAQEWAEASVTGRKLSTSSINQRFAIISSYYQYCIKQGACDINPIEYCERPPRQVENAAPDLDAEYVNLRLRDIDTRTLEGLRDMALISIALTTGRRAAELAGLQWGHLTRQGSKVRAKWVRCKGGKTMEDDLKAKTVKHLLRYVQALYGPNLDEIPEDAPLFVSLSNRKRLRDGKQIGLSHQAISNIYQARLGVSQVHASRHTFAVGMSDAGAGLEEIGDRLGHSNYKVTADYMKRRKAARNKHGDALEEMFGL